LSEIEGGGWAKAGKQRERVKITRGGTFGTMPLQKITEYAIEGVKKGGRASTRHGRTAGGKKTEEARTQRGMVLKNGAPRKPRGEERSCYGNQEVYRYPKNNHKMLNHRENSQFSSASRKVKKDSRERKVSKKS